MHGKRRCRIYGGKSPGAPKGKANGNYQTGAHTGEGKLIRAISRALSAEARELIKKI